MIEAYIKIFVRNTIRLLLHVFKFFPIKKGRILFESYDGIRMACNPKYLYDYFKKNNSDKFEYVWALCDAEIVQGDETVKYVKMPSLKWIYYEMTSEVVISNTRPKNIIPPRKKQTFIETWHAGGAYKEVGDNIKSLSKKQRIIADWGQKRENKRIDVFLSSSKVFTDFNINKAHRYHGNVLNTGMPRNDIFFNEEERNKICEKVKKEFGIKGKAVLYAPTWRSTDEKEEGFYVEEFDYSRLVRGLQESWGTDVVVLYRGHHWSNDVSLSDSIIDATNYPDMQELLCAVDALITDYSSSIWDYSLAGKPSFLYVPDLNVYGDKLHGFFTPIEDWPGVICENMDELVKEMCNINYEEHASKAKLHHIKMGSYEKGTACEEVLNYIKSL